MFEQVTPTVRYARAPTAIGVVTRGDRALLVDSGLDENLVRKVVNALANEGVTVAAVVNTHSHADHIGGNAWLVKRTGARVAAPAAEQPFVERPELEPWSLFGAPAPGVLRGKFLMAQPSRVDQPLAGAGVVDVAGFEVRLRDLPGHSLHQMGVEVDGVLFVGDALLPADLVQKYGLVFAVDPLEARASAARLREEAPRHVVAYHGGLLADVEGAIAAGTACVDQVEAAIHARLARSPVSAEELLAELLDRFPPSARSVELHALQEATVRGYLSALERAGRVEAFLEGYRLLWRGR